MITEQNIDPMAGEDLTAFYIANCIRGILAARCTNRGLIQRNADLTQIIKTVGASGLQTGHQQALDIHIEAENGRYNIQ